MEVLIVSKTHMSSAACVGGLVLNSNRYIRLLNPGNYNQPSDTDFEVGEIWDLEFTNRINPITPHIEDVVITSRRYTQSVVDIATFLIHRNLIDWQNHINNLFGGLLHWTSSGTGYIPLGGRMPKQSVGFWKTDQDLIRSTFEGNKVRYRYPNSSNYRNISYVGFQETIQTIPAGTILRVSLSRAFPQENSTINVPRGFYLQLSGWYINEKPVSFSSAPSYFSDDDDLPF